MLLTIVVHCLYINIFYYTNYFVAYDAFIFWVTYLRGMLYLLLLLHVHVWVLSTAVSCLRFLQPVTSFTRFFDVSIYLFLLRTLANYFQPLRYDCMSDDSPTFD